MAGRQAIREIKGEEQAPLLGVPRSGGVLVVNPSQEGLPGFYRGVHQTPRLSATGETIEHAKFWIPPRFEQALRDWVLFEFSEPAPHPGQYGNALQAGAEAKADALKRSRAKPLSYDERLDLYQFFYRMASYKLQKQHADSASQSAGFRFDPDSVLPLNDYILPLDIVIDQLPQLCQSLVDRTRGEAKCPSAEYWLDKIIKTFRGDEVRYTSAYEPTRNEKFFLWFHKDLYDHVGSADALWLSLCSIIPTISSYVGFQANAQASLAPNYVYQQVWNLLAGLMKPGGVGQTLASSKVGAGVFACVINLVLGLCFAALAYNMEIKAYKKRRLIEFKQKSSDKLVSPEKYKELRAEYDQDITREAAALKAKLKDGMISWQVASSVVNLGFHIVMWTTPFHPTGLLMLAVCLSIAIAAGAAEAYGYCRAFENKEREKFIDEYKDYVKTVDKMVYAQDKAEKAWVAYKASPHFACQKWQYGLAAFWTGCFWQMMTFLPGFGVTCLSAARGITATWSLVSALAFNLVAVVSVKQFVSRFFKWRLEKTSMTKFIKDYEIESLALTQDDGRAVIAVQWPDGEQANNIAGRYEKGGVLHDYPVDYQYTTGLRLSQWMGQRHKDKTVARPAGLLDGMARK